MKNLIGLLALVLSVAAQAEGLIPDGAVNIATTSGKKVVSYENMQSSNNAGNLFNDTRDRWLGLTPKPVTGKYPSETITFLEQRPLVNAYRVLRGTGHSGDKNQGRQATTWELFGSNDDGATWTLIHAQTEPVVWYESGKSGDDCLIDNVDCVFDNAIHYSSYKFRVTTNGGDGSYVSIDDVKLYSLRLDDMLAIEDNGFFVGEPTPAYGAFYGMDSGDKVLLSMADTRVVDPLTSRRYELTGFAIKAADGTVLHEGTVAELPYEYEHGEHGATVIWNWSDPLGEFVAARRSDITVFENANFNEITDGKADGSAVSYYNNGARSKYGPQYVFDSNTESDSNSRWFLGCGAPVYVQYVFKKDGAPVRRMVTGMSLFGSAQNGRQLYDFDLKGSNDGQTWTTLLSVDSPLAVSSGTWDFANTASYSHYRLDVSRAGGNNLEMYNLELYNHRGDDVLEILGSPAYGQPDPDYGVVSGLVAGEERLLTAPSTEVEVSADEKSVCTGYTLVSEGSDPVDCAGTTCSYVHSGKGTALTWKFSSTYRQRVGVAGAGSVDCAAEAFVAGGTVLTITATPDSADEPFLTWQGDVPEGQADNPVLTFTVDRPRSLTAVFAAPTHVSATGDDANDGSSWEKAVRTVARGWELCGGAGKLRLGEGEFSVKPGVLAIAGALRLEGQGPDRTVLVADNSEGGGTLLAVGHEQAVVTGVRVKGATFSSGVGAGIAITSGMVTNCCVDSCASSGNGGGVWLNGTTALLVDSVVTNCTAGATAGGVYVSSGTFLRNLVTGCRALICGGAYFQSATTVADSVFRGNAVSGGGCHGGAVGCNSESILFTNCVFEANSSAEKSGVAMEYCPGVVTFEDCLFTNNTSKGRCAIGMHFYGTILRSRIVDNSSGGEYGVLNLDAKADVVGSGTLKNCLVSGNSGGQCVIYLCSGTLVHNCTVVSNLFSARGAIVFDRNTGGTVRNSVIAGNYSGNGTVVSNVTGSAANAVYCCIPDHDPSTLGTGSIAAVPLFDDAAAGDYTLRWNSPCVNAGANSYVEEGELDLVGNPRIHSFGGRAKHDVVDMGCYESPFRRTKGLQVLIR